MLVGRYEECKRVERLLADARLGRSAVLLFRGDAGVGKTALLEFAIQEADGFDVLHVAGVESETELPYAALHALLRPLVGLLDELPEVQACALRVALGLEAGAADPFLAAAGTLTLLALAADQRPLLLALDDAHWIDGASRDALVFVARRLAAESIAVVFATRSVESVLERTDFSEIAVAALKEDEALELLRERWGADLDSSVALRLAAATGGNALALVEVSDQLSESERLGRAPLPEPLPVSAVVERSVRQKLAELPPSARDAVLLAAVDDNALRVVPVEALGPAERSGLVQLHQGRVLFSHPLFRAAVHRSVAPDDVRAAHRRVADALSDPGEDDLRAWHLAAAAVSPDEEAAAALEAAADRAEARGGTAARARALERAAQLSEDDDERARRLYGAADAARVAGETGRARELNEEALSLVEQGSLLHADLVHELSALQDWYGPPVPVEMLEREADAIASMDSERAAKLLGQALVHYFERDLDARALIRTATRIEPLLPELGEWWHPRALGWVAHARLLSGDAHEAAELYREILDDPLAATTQAPALIWLELYDDARRALQVSLDVGRSRGQPLRIAWTQACFGKLHETLDRHPEAVAAAAEAISLAEEIGADSVAAEAVLVLANVAAKQDREDDCRSLTAQAEAYAERLCDQVLELSAALPPARLAVARGAYGEAVQLLRPVAERLSAGGFRHPSPIPYAPDLIEAYVRSGAVDDGRRELDGFAAQAEATQTLWALAAVARYEGLLAGKDGFDGWFGEALARHERVPSPFAEARTRLCYGERLRRDRRRREAREQLRPALHAFEAIGARSWAARARAELGATGESIPRRDPTTPEKLTPQELQIALQVAEGKTNRDVAAALFLSPKTVEYHLTHVYRKLELHSRAELIRLLATEAEPAAFVH